MLTIQTSPIFQAEKEYAFHVLLNEMLGIPYQITYQALGSHIICLPNGAKLKMKDDFAGLELPDPDFFGIKLSGSLPPNHEIPKSSNQQFPDLFANTFFMLTRWEETHSKAHDEHGRFPANKSIAWQQGFLHRPVVNEWADWLWQALAQLGWRGERKQRKFKISISCDVDHPRLWWSAADRVRTLGGAVFKRGDLREPAYWLRNYVYKKKDPFDVFDEWLDIFEKNDLVAQFNFMGERSRSSDCWYPIRHPFLRNLMNSIADRGHLIGFHPSYEAFENQTAFVRELKSLQEISPLEISSGRQHYLRFSAPKTWQVWEAAGLKEDCTLGYAEAEGFRCGICHDFPVFDTEQRKMLQLREKPLIAMDVTLAQYRGYTPEQAAEQLFKLRSEVVSHGGDFTLLWHNSSWNTPFWEKWKAVFLEFIFR